MDQQRLLDLIEKFQANTATEEEIQELDELYMEYESKAGYIDALTNAQQEAYKELFFGRIDDQIKETEPIEFVSEKKTIRLWPRIAAAASILLCCSIGAYFYLKPKPQVQTVQIANDLKPGINGAVLTLANGQKVVLEKTKVGAITRGVNKSNDSLLVYKDTEVSGYNTLETPKGHQYSVVLPDGSKVWLNAASSLKYPTRFSGNERLVELTGEGYFEVVHNGKMPFRVKTNNQITEDIGTSFNINSYDDEAATTTSLVEGAVRVNNTLLKPGFAAISKTPTSVVVKEVDLEEITAWKNGAFSFNKTDIKTVMRQIARWYDVEVAYEGEVPTKTITGDVHRNVNASQALKILTYLSIQYRIEGKKIIITK
jgi:hypothetical protein